MTETHVPSTEGPSTIAARQRGCYCALWDTSSEFHLSRGYPRGFCGTCERCGKPGHTRHFPGPVPYTGAWCDWCCRIVAWTWPLRTLAGWYFIALVATVLLTLAWR